MSEIFHCHEIETLKTQNLNIPKSEFLPYTDGYRCSLNPEHEL